MIEVDRISKRFGEVEAVKEVTFRAERGKVTGLLGPNGAGKSTSLRIIAGVLKADGGSVKINGHDVQKSPDDARMALGVLPHAKGLYPRLTGRENIRYYGKLNGLRGEELENNINSLIEMLDISEFADRKAEGYSQGQGTKVALARAMVHRPDAIVLDEPTNGLDVMATRSLRELIHQLRDTGKCVLLSSHVMQEVGALCDEIIIIAHGKMLAHGSPDAIRRQTGKENLEDAFVAVIGTEEGLA
ncbi:MAG: ATP-binding cassette domain-containing protein [Gammaproteobacteria bacterium]|nr:ATP-binding cassette domain-containing protein [Gammaproteobacteria bacterium]